MFRKIPLTQGQWALIDDWNHERVRRFHWYAVRSSNGKYWYARSMRGGKRPISLHKFIMRPRRGVLVDHKNRDGLDCRESNMRLCSYRQSKMNRAGWGRSGYKGVTRNHKGWRARIRVLGEEINLGTFPTAKEAAGAYNEVALEHHGEFAVLNDV